MLTNSSQVSIHTKTVLSHRNGQPETAPPEITGTIDLAETLSGRVQTVKAEAEQLIPKTVLSHRYGQPETAPPKITGIINLAETLSGRVQTVKAEAEQLIPRPATYANHGTPAVTNVADASHSSEASPQSPTRLRSGALSRKITPRVSTPMASVQSPSASRYGERVWAALARHKPKAVQRGSTTVTFKIGASGALGYVRVDQSSGNARLDQLALQTVQDSAPFPLPPNGASSYMIRIHFQ
jgi:protein TonB